MAARTAAAALTQTAILIPQTLTASIMPLPTGMPSFFFNLTPGTATPNPQGAVPTPGGSGSGEFSCKLLSQSFPNGKRFSPRDSFSMGWMVSNNGAAAWDPSSMDFAYLAGTKMYLEERIYLPATVAAGGTIALTVDMMAPKNAGTYTTVWALRRGTDAFCRLSMTIIVR